MDVLAVNRRVLTLLYVCPTTEGTNKWKEIFYIVFTTLTTAANVCGFIASSFFFGKFVTTDLESSLHALLQMAALGAATYMLVVGLFSRHEINEIFNHLKKIYDESKCWLEFNGFSRFSTFLNSMNWQIS